MNRSATHSCIFHLATGSQASTNKFTFEIVEKIMKSLHNAIGGSGIVQRTENRKGSDLFFILFYY